MDGIILIQKPENISSHDLVLKARRILNTKKIGHTGTLDPLASGLMMLTVGKATKLLPYIVDHDKEYICEMVLGYSTDTLDITGTIKEEKNIAPFSKEDVLNVFDDMTGPQLQVPPMYSSKKLHGQKLYDLARKNIEVEREAVPINIYNLELIDFSDYTIKYRVKCSSGTYVRVLCTEIAERLYNLGCMKSLVRTAIDDYKLSDACTLDDLREGNYQLLTAYDVLKKYPYYELDDIQDVLNGKPLELNSDDELVMITHSGEVIAAYEKETDGKYICRRGLW